MTEEKCDDKGRKKRKLDVTDKDNGGDVTNGSEQEDKRRKKGKPDLTDNANDGDVTNGSEQDDDKRRKKRKPDVKNESDVNEEVDEVIILKKNQNYSCEFMKISASSAEEE